MNKNHKIRFTKYNDWVKWRIAFVSLTHSNQLGSGYFIPITM